MGQGNHQKHNSYILYSNLQTTCPYIVEKKF
jgi:hypothetical protein